MKQSLALPPKFDSLGRKIGALTGVLLEDSGIKINKHKGQGIQLANMSEQEMWEMKQLKGGQALHLVQDLQGNPMLQNDGEPDEPDAHMNQNDEYDEIELNEDEAPFLRG